jgi:UDP:flavonoid glycosyltransferase YjiC (YdhE family)
MARIAFAWELGGEYGHAVSCSGLGAALHRRGHSIALMFRETAQLTLLPEARAFEIFQAPRAELSSAMQAWPASFADILLGFGYGDSASLAQLLGAWRKLLAQWSPDLLIADFAPTALLAARTLGIPRAAYGNGFFIPPHQSPIPPFRIDEPVDPARVESADRTALANVNAALGSIGAARLERLEQAFESDQDFLCTFPELDHYGTRETSGYWGPRMRIDLGHVVDWPDGPGRRVFVYVKTSLPQLDALIDALVARPHRVLAFIPGLDERRRARLASASRRVLGRPVRLDAALRGCDLLVSHGGEIAGGALCHGVPSLLFPSHYEQYLMALRQRQLGTGAWLPFGATAQDVAAALDGLLRDDRALGNARAFARRYPAWSPPEQRRRIVARIEELLAPARG